MSLAGNAYASDEDFMKLEKVWDVSKWSDKMREPMEKIYGKVCLKYSRDMNIGLICC